MLKQSIFSGILVSFVLTCIYGCSGNASDPRQARLVADENFRIKQQMKTTQSRLDSCTKELEQYKAENEKVKKDADETVNFAMTTVKDEYEKELQQLKAENQQLKQQLQKK